MNFIDDLRYSSEAEMTNYYFYQGLNDINIFVEDLGKEYEYETILKNLLGGQYKIIKILGVGGKEFLKKSFHEFGIFDIDNPNIKNIFIADGDFDRYIYAEDMISNENFIYLEPYNIENYFIDKEASEKFVKGKLKCSDKEVESKLEFISWKNKIVYQAKKLFLLYCFVKKNYPTKECVSRNPYYFLDDMSGFEKQGSYEKYRYEIMEINTNLDLESEIINIDDSYNSIFNDDGFNLICGKFLFESLYCHIRKIVKSPIKKEDFRWHLICNFDINKLDYLKERILCIITS